MEYKVNVNRTKQIIELAQLFEARTCEKPILCLKQNMFHNLTNIEEIETNGVPQRVLKWYGYEMVVFPNDSVLQDDIVYVYNEKQVQDSAIEYLNNKCHELLKTTRQWLFGEWEK